MIRRCSPAGIKLIQDFEGLRLRAYADSAGYSTIGWGHKLNPIQTEVYKGRKITRDEADRLLWSDLDVAERVLSNERYTDKLNENQFAALCSLIFNIGGQRFLTSQTRKYLELGNFQTASNEWAGFVYAGGTYKKGLARRRMAELALFWSLKGISDCVTAEDYDTVRFLLFSLFNSAPLKEVWYLNRDEYPEDSVP